MIGLRRVIFMSGILLSFALNAQNSGVYAQGSDTQIKPPGNTDSINNNFTAEKSTVLHNNKVLIKNIIFKGNTQIKTEVLQKMVSYMIGREASIDQIKDLSAEITKYYRDRGYLTSLAYVAPQNIDNGNLEITIVEGKIGYINIQGTKWVKTSFVKNNILKANDFSKDKIFNVNSLRKSLNDLNDNEYLKGQVTLKKGEQPETTDIILNIKEKLPLNLSAGWDNLGRDLVGVQRGNITLTDSNLTGFGDSLYGGISLASRTFGANTGYSIPLGPYGTQLKFGYGYSKVNLGGDYKEYKIDGASHLFSTSILQPIYKDNNLQITSDLSLDMDHSKTTMQGSTELQKYQINTIRYGLTGIRDDLSGRWISRGELCTGLPFWGATSKSSYGVGSSKFVKMDANLIRVQSLPFKTTGILRITGQLSPNTMLAPEQMQIGGMYSVRGYDEGVLLGDVGYTASFEVRKPIPYLPDMKWLPLKNKVQFAAFYDQGYAKTIHQSDDTKVSKMLNGVGVGLRINLTKYIMANVDFGVPLSNRKVLKQNSMKIHFGLSSSLI